MSSPNWRRSPAVMKLPPWRHRRSWAGRRASCPAAARPGRGLPAPAGHSILPVLSTMNEHRHGNEDHERRRRGAQRRVSRSCPIRTLLRAPFVAREPPANATSPFFTAPHRAESALRLTSCAARVHAPQPQRSAGCYNPLTSSPSRISSGCVRGDGCRSV